MSLYQLDIPGVVWLISCFTGGVYLINDVLIEKSIIWSDFNIGSDEWELLQTGLGLFFLQVGARKTVSVVSVCFKHNEKKMFKQVF